MKKLAWLLFLLSATGELVSSVMTIQGLEHACKPLIMLSLGIWYYVSTGSQNRSFLVIGAIVFSWAGDILLISPQNFIAGLLCFLLAHLFYTLSYRQHRFAAHGDSLQGIQRMRLAFPIILAGTGFVVVLYPVLGELKIPVMVYAIVIVFMTLTALFRWGRTGVKSFWMVFAGAILFMGSDMLLAVNKFLTPIQAGSFWVMLTYIIAQSLIIRGLVKHTE